MKSGMLLRTSSNDQGTDGFLMLPGLILNTMELPCRDNRQNMSCIPADTYIVVPFTSQRFGRVWHVLDVQGRLAILIHSLNFAGDTAMGYRTGSHGCIGVGMKRGILGGQKAILSSRIAIGKLRMNLLDESFRLTIINNWEVKRLA